MYVGATFEILAVVTMSQSNCLGGDVSHSGVQLLTRRVSTPLHVYFVYVCDCAHCLILSALQCVRHISIEHTLGYFAHTHHASVTVTYISTIMNHESYHYVSPDTSMDREAEPRLLEACIIIARFNCRKISKCLFNYNNNNHCI